MAGGGGGDGKTPTLNVVSMVDVIFNVIVFFIITAKAASDEMPKLVVPKVDTPMATAAPANPPPRMIISVLGKDNDKTFDLQMKELQTTGIIGAIGISSGRAYEVRVGDEHLLVPQQLPRLTQLVKEVKTKRTKGLSEKDAKTFEVLLRADLALPYSEVRPVMNAISSAGIQNVNLMAYKQ